MNLTVCRCCLVSHPAISYKIFERENLCTDLIECVPSLNIAPNDGLPDLICDLCWLRLREAIDFRRKCIAAESELRNFSGTSEIFEVNSSGILMDFDAIMSPLAVLTDKTEIINEEAALCNATMLPSELTADEVFMLNSQLFEDYHDTFISHMDFQREDPVIAELLNAVYEDEPLATAATTTITPKLISYNSNFNEIKNQSSVVSSTTPTSPTSDSNYSTSSSTTSTKKRKQLAHICNECGKQFTRNFQLKLHLSSVHSIGAGLQYQCEDCHKNFASLHSLSYHRKSLHTEERPFVCEKCDRRFVLRSQLASHERIHTGAIKPRIHKCLKCDKVWPTKSDLRTHMRTHDPNVERRFKCDQCEKRFLTKGHLAAHIFVHTGEKPFRCILCYKSYQCVGNLNNHMVKCHSDVVPCRSRQKNRLFV